MTEHSQSEFDPIGFRRVGGLQIAHLGPIDIGCVGPLLNSRKGAFWRSYLPGFVGATVKHSETLDHAKRALVKSALHWFEACGHPLQKKEESKHVDRG